MKKRPAVIILLCALVAMSIAGTADAQFWKKKSKRKKYKQEQAATADTAAVHLPQLTKKEKRKKERQERKRLKKEKKHGQQPAVTAVKKAVPKPAPAVKERAEVVFPPTQFKARYRIDVLAGLYLDELVKGKYITYNSLPEKAQPGVGFVEGVNIAADSMRWAGYNVDIYVHDAASFQESPEMLIRQGRLDSSDLIIGALPPQSLPGVAAFAHKRQIYFISALGDNDGGVKDNQFFTILHPSQKMYCDHIADEVTKKYPGRNITVLYRTNNAADNSAYAFLADTARKLHVNPMLCNTLPKRQQLLSVVDTAGVNVIMIPVSDVVYADSLLRDLSRSFPHTHFEIYGMSSWEAMTDLHKAKMFPDLAINIPQAFHYDPASAAALYVERDFKKEYSGKPAENVFEGFETMIWYADLLKTYGTIFKYTDNAPAPFTPFHISPQWDKNNNLLYNVNGHIFLVRYENGNTKTE